MGAVVKDDGRECTVGVGATGISPSAELDGVAGAGFESLSPPQPPTVNTKAIPSMLARCCCMAFMSLSLGSERDLTHCCMVHGLARPL